MERACLKITPVIPIHTFLHMIADFIRTHQEEVSFKIIAMVILRLIYDLPKYDSD